MKNITINTDAGFYPHDKVGSFAYWIVGEEFRLKGSGMLKGEIKCPTEAETKAICNAVYVLTKSGADLRGVSNIYINRDNIRAVHTRFGKPCQKKLRSLLQSLKKLCREHKMPEVHYRHVKAHSNKNDKRSYVNKWCDSECTRQLRKWRIANPLPQKQELCTTK